MVKVKDIAKIAKVSAATVSLVINDKPGVSKETRKKVLDIIRESGYETNITKIDTSNEGKSIRYLIYKKYGMVIDKNGFISALTDGINIGAMKLGYDVIITTVIPSNKDSVIQMVKDDPKAGLILLGTEMQCEDYDFLKEIHCPVVVVDSYLEFVDYDCVVMNNTDTSYKAVKYLYDKGCRIIGNLKSSPPFSNLSAREEGYKKSLEKLGLEYKPEYTFSLEPTMEGSYRDMLKILATNPDLPEALFAVNDTIAIGAMKALKEYNVKIPEELSIIGIDDIQFCLMVEPTLSTVRIFKEEIGTMAVKRLINKIKKKDSSVIKMQIGAELVERNSTRK